MSRLTTIVLVFVFGVISVQAETPSGFTVSDFSINDAAAESTPAAEQTPATQSAVQTDPAKHKSVGKTVLFWLLVPGGGNFYTGDKTKGFIELGSAVGGFALMASSIRDECSSTSRFIYCSSEVSPGRFWSGFGAMAGVRVWGLITAIHRAQDINSGKITALERLRFTVPTRKSGFQVAYSFGF